MTPRPQHGEVWLADLGLAGKTRPVEILSRTEVDPPRALTIDVPILTCNRRFFTARFNSAFLSFTRNPSVIGVRSFVNNLQTPQITEGFLFIHYFLQSPLKEFADFRIRILNPISGKG